MTKKFFGLNLFGLAAFLTLSFLPINDTNASIKIGASMPLTGNFAVPGSKHLEGYEMCVDIINRHGGWLDQEVELVVSDNRSDISKISYKLNNKTEIELDSNLLEIIKDFFLASNGYVSYAGEFNVDDINVYHNLKISLLPQWVGTVLTRKYKFSAQNNILNLTAELNGFKDSLKWEKI